MLTVEAVAIPTLRPLAATAACLKDDKRSLGRRMRRQDHAKWRRLAKSIPTRGPGFTTRRSTSCWLSREASARVATKGDGPAHDSHVSHVARTKHCRDQQAPGRRKNALSEDVDRPPSLLPGPLRLSTLELAMPRPMGPNRTPAAARQAGFSILRRAPRRLKIRPGKYRS